MRTRLPGGLLGLCFPSRPSICEGYERVILNYLIYISAVVQDFVL